MLKDECERGRIDINNLFIIIKAKQQKYTLN